MSKDVTVMNADEMIATASVNYDQKVFEHKQRARWRILNALSYEPTRTQIDLTYSMPPHNSRMHEEVVEDLRAAGFVVDAKYHWLFGYKCVVSVAARRIRVVQGPYR